ncbi:MAG: response regulator transcription factor [Deltaproteobacteria bacterium]|nr:response regulator transcription factor [Deltaproteobacteria bacterium]
MAKRKMTRAKARTAKVLVVDDHPVLRQGLAALIDHTPDLRVCAQTQDAPGAIAAVRATKPDVVVLDLSLEGGSGLDLLGCLKTTHPELPVLVLSTHDESLYAERALRAGARGYIMKERPIPELMAAIHLVLAGEVYLSDKMSSRLVRRAVRGEPIESASSVAALSNRELEVFELVGKGYDANEIASRLHLSIKTVHAHRENIKRKLNLGSGTELHQQAFMWIQSEPAARERTTER